MHTVTCMDPRVVPEQFLPNAQFAVFRNAGGRYSSDLVRTIATVRKLMADKPGAKTTVMVVHHTGTYHHSPIEKVKTEVDGRKYVRSTPYN